MKILIADFKIQRYGGIIEHVSAKVRALKALGHEVDIAQLTPSATTQSAYDKKVSEIKNGEFQDKLQVNSQNGGYEFDEATGYYKNNYYGFFLPPSNRIGVYEPDAFERWHELTKDVDIIMWNFMPTKSKAWGENDFSFWWKFFDFPTDKVKQIFTAHDAYFDVRASNVTALKDKIFFLECAHVAAYKCCENLGMRRELLLNPRYLKKGDKMPIKSKTKREFDFFAAHIFKSMKKIDDLLRAVPYLGDSYTTLIAGSGIEQAYMTAPTKCKEAYKVSLKRDPDVDPKRVGEKIWDVAEEYGFSYLGQISSKEVEQLLLNSKFAVDPSWAKHYANYCRTHINGFIIEAMLNGCYPVIRDYRGLVKGAEEVYDPLFESIRAVVIPWDATPKQFAEALIEANKMTDEKYLEDTKHNFELVHNYFNATSNMEHVIRLVKGGQAMVDKELEIGVDSDKVKEVTEDIMTGFFDIELPIIWEND